MFIGLALIFVGVVFMLERLDVTSVELDKLWPVLVIIVELSMLTQRVRQRR
jgi:hypothetical protein